MTAGIGMLLKAMGVNVTEDQIKMVEALIPQIPSRINQAGNAINAAIQQFDTRLKALEASNERIEEFLYAGRIGTGDTRKPDNGGSTNLG